LTCNTQSKYCQDVHVLSRLAIVTVVGGGLFLLTRLLALSVAFATECIGWQNFQHSSLHNPCTITITCVIGCSNFYILAIHCFSIILLAGCITAGSRSTTVAGGTIHSDGAIITSTIHIQEQNHRFVASITRHVRLRANSCGIHFLHRIYQLF
jgi:hypothetical protein